MAKAQPYFVDVEVDPFTKTQVSTELKEIHGVHGLSFIDEVEFDETVEPHLRITPAILDESLDFHYRTKFGERLLNSARDNNSIQKVLSRIALDSFYIDTASQSSRPDTILLSEHRGSMPSVKQDPSLWLANNPLIADLSRRIPKYGNLIRFLCNERGLFLKVANYPIERAYWNSSTNGGLPVYKKADSIHEGTFMLHDMLHFIPADPLIGPDTASREKRAIYLTHRLMSEASTLVMADMIAVDEANLAERGYDITKRQIFPVYKSIVERTGIKPTLEKLLAANAYFCFTGDAEGFSILGASEVSLKKYKEKYETVFRDDFMWNLYNLNFMIEEQAANPLVVEYYEWIAENTSIPLLNLYPKVVSPEGGIDLPKALSHFRSDFQLALNYNEPINDSMRFKKASEKYLAGQRLVFARFGNSIDAEPFRAKFDQHFNRMIRAENMDERSHAFDHATSVVTSYLNELARFQVILPHEHELFRYSVPLYPIKFVNYERNNANPASLQSEMSSFIDLNKKQLSRLLEAAAA